MDEQFIKKMGYTLESFNDYMNWVLNHICNEKKDLWLLNKKSEECILPYVLTCLVDRGVIRIKVVPGNSGLSVMYTCNNPKDTFDDKIFDKKIFG